MQVAGVHGADRVWNSHCCPDGGLPALAGEAQLRGVGVDEAVASRAGECAKVGGSSPSWKSLSSPNPGQP